MTGFSIMPPSYYVKFLGTDRLPHCDHTLTYYQPTEFYIEENGDFSCYYNELSGEFPFAIEVGTVVELYAPSSGSDGSCFGKLYSVYNITSSYIYMHPYDPEDFCPRPSGLQPGAAAGYGYSLRQHCQLTENYYTEEYLKFQLVISSSGSAGGIKIVGTPRIGISITGSNGTYIKYAELDRASSFSSDSDMASYLIYKLLIEGSDRGVPSLHDAGYSSLPCDDNNAVKYKVSTEYGLYYYNICGYPSSYYNQYSLGQITDMSRVRINMDGEPSGQNTSQSTILLKRSSVPNKKPMAADLILGEVALNTNDATLYTKKESGDVVPIKDVLEYVDISKFPVTGTSAKLYIAKNNNKLYRWDGSQYVEISSVEPQIFNTNSIQINSNQNNLDIGITSVARLVATTPGLTVTGFSPAGSDGEIKIIYNAGVNSISISHNDPASSSNKKVLTYNSNTFSLEPNAGVTILYDGITGAWRLF